MKNISSSFLPSLAAGVAAVLCAGYASADTLYVSESTNNTISIINTATNTVTSNIGSSQYLYTPEGLAFNSSGDLFIANYGTYPNGGFIEEYNPTTQAFTSFATGLANPDGLAFDSAGDLYVANHVGGTITEFANGSNVGVVIASGLPTPNGIAIDKFGDLYVGLGNGVSKIARIAPGGAVTEFNTTGTSTDQPNGVTFGPDGNLYAANYGNNTIEKITTNMIGSTYVANTPSNMITNPVDMAFDSEGDLYVTDYSTDMVTEYNAAGQLIGSNSTTAICGPTFLAFGPGGSLAVPEPSTYAMMLGGLAVLYFFQRRRTRVLARI